MSQSKSSYVPQKTARMKGIEEHYGLQNIWMAWVRVSLVCAFFGGVYWVWSKLMRIHEKFKSTARFGVRRSSEPETSEYIKE